MFEDAKASEPDNPNLYYNLGLVYFDLKDYANALKNAQQAYRLGSAFPGLRDKLKSVNRWEEPPVQDAASSSTPADSEPTPAPPQSEPSTAEPATARPPAPMQAPKRNRSRH
jgi:tetratricopeptide (TPR) repeat protein